MFSIWKCQNTWEWFGDFFQLNSEVLPKRECEDVKHVEISTFSVTWKTYILFWITHHYLICFSFRHVFAFANDRDISQKPMVIFKIRTSPH